MWAIERLRGEAQELLDAAQQYPLLYPVHWRSCLGLPRAACLLAADALEAAVWLEVLRDLVQLVSG